jgi:predicted ATPase
MAVVHEAVLRTLPELGYEPVIVPTGSVEERTAFVLRAAA